ncbi:MAG TPA: zf-HC2 domain-containing protein [Actinomycetes bacterium]|nr:zf-HC2 domain-containing protein [Actinomycetes bacterium]
MNWHVDRSLANGYASGEVTGARAASVEAHLLSCAQCRGLVNPLASESRLAVVWDEVQERVDSPESSWIIRLLTTLRVPEPEARLLAAAPSLQRSWLFAVIAVLGFAAASTHIADSESLLFLVLAPLVPVVAVAGAYGKGIDPTYELTLSTVYPTYRLLLLRVAAVLVASLVLTGVAALTVSDTWMTVAWLLPSLAMVGLALVLSRWLELPVAGVSVIAIYVVGVASSWANEIDLHELFEEPAQLLSLAVVVGCCLFVLVPLHRPAAVRRLP